MATRNSGYRPRAFDKFYTPFWVVRHDLASVWEPPRNSQFWEPCAGDGGLAREISDTFGKPCFASDLKPDRKQLYPVTRMDFLTSHGISTAAQCPLIIISNPPYGEKSELALRFLAHALDVTEASGGSVVFLLPFTFDANRPRRGLFGYHPAYATKVLCSRRIRWRNIAQAKNGPSTEHALFIYEWQARRRNAWALKQSQVAA